MYSKYVYCCTELAVSSLAVAETITSTHCAYHGGMARLSWPGWLRWYARRKKSDRVTWNNKGKKVNVGFLYSAAYASDYQRTLNSSTVSYRTLSYRIVVDRRLFVVCLVSDLIKPTCAVENIGLCWRDLGVSFRVAIIEYTTSEPRYEREGTTAASDKFQLERTADDIVCSRHQPHSVCENHSARLPSSLKRLLTQIKVDKLIFKSSRVHFINVVWISEQQVNLVFQT